jgi:hypothetical protein
MFDKNRSCNFKIIVSMPKSNNFTKHSNTLRTKWFASLIDHQHQCVYNSLPRMIDYRHFDSVHCEVINQLFYDFHLIVQSNGHTFYVWATNWKKKLSLLYNNHCLQTIVYNIYVYMQKTFFSSSAIRYFMT